jgi:translation initiation factor 2B subunit (eIF-2B alpha/beta/delta family)
MATSKSYVGLVAASEKLLAAVAANAEALGSVEPFREPFEQVVARLKALVTRRDTMQADKQTLSRQLRDTAKEVSDAAIDFRVQIKAALGTKSEKLTEFDLRPRRQVVRSDPGRSRKVAVKPDSDPSPPAKK